MEWSPDDLAEGRVVTVPDEVYARGCVKTAEEGLSAAQNIGFPVMIKASEGGGGKGIRKSTNADDFPNLFRQVRLHVTKVNFNAVQVHITMEHGSQSFSDKHSHLIELRMLEVKSGKLDCRGKVTFLR